jgi:hypothetical protein
MSGIFGIVMSAKQLINALVLLSSVTFAATSHSAGVILEQDWASATTRSDLTPKQIMDARKQFHVEVLSFDTSKRYGSTFPYSDYVKLRITNNSDVTLPYITPLTKRYSNGRAIGWSRAPVIAVHDLGPKQSKTIDYYPHGHLSVVPVDKVTVEIEPTIDEEEMRLFKELAR